MDSTSTADGVPSIAGFDRLELIGRGGFSTVYRAWQPAMHRNVAVKVLDAGFSSDTDRKAFERECRAMGTLSGHANIATVYDNTVTGDGRPCIVMRLYEQSYRERLDDLGVIPIAELLSLGVKVAGALQSAHEARVLHRDIKPHNIFFESEYGEPALGDFGISTIADERTQSELSGLSIAYASPEVLEDEAATESGDVYALAATMYHLAAGSPPFAADTVRASVARILGDPAPRLERVDAPDALGDVLRWGLEKSAAARPRSAAELGEALRDVEASVGLDRTPLPVRSGGGSASSRSSRPAGHGAGSSPAARTHRPPGERTLDRRGGDEESIEAAATGVVSVPPATAVAATAPRSEAPTGAAPTTERTVRRRGDAPDESVDEPIDTVGQRRRWIAIGLGALAVIAVVALLVLPLGGGAESETTTTAIVAEEPDDFFTTLRAPTSVSVVDGEAGIVIEVSAVDGAVSYEAEVVPPSAGAGALTSSDTPTIATGLDAIDHPCWVVRVLGDGGRISVDSDTVCLE